MLTMRRWTDEEVDTLVQAVSNSPHNLTKCFIAVGQKINRTPGAIQYKWYTDVRNTSKGRKAMLTISKSKIYPGKICTDKSKVKPVKVSLTKRLWVTLTSFVSKR